MIKTNIYISSSLGYWTDEFSEFHSNTSFSINSIPNSTEEDKSNLLSISSDDYIPQNGDRIYFLPGVNVPRVKFKNLCDEKGIRTVRDPEKANIFIGNTSSVEKLTKSIWVYPVQTKHFKELVEHKEFQSNIDGHYLEKLESILEFYTEETIYIDRPLMNIIRTKIADDTLYGNSTPLYCVEEDYVNLYELIKNFKIYSEATVIDQLNGEDAAIIDAEIYDQLCTMLSSSDTDNVVLAMEIMANCKYTPSLNYLMLLFYNYSSEIFNSHTRNHVNFKSLIGWLGAADINRERMIHILKEKDKLNQESLDHLFSYIGEDIAKYGESHVFRMKTITLSAELLSDMNLNYSYNIQPEFVPEVSDTEVEDVLFSDDDIETALLRVERNELKSELIALEENLAKEDLTPVKEEEESNNNQIEQANDTNNFEWF